MCWHKWNKWSELVKAYSGTFQYRNCKKCNIVKKKRADYSNYFNITIWNTDMTKEGKA